MTGKNDVIHKPEVSVMYCNDARDDRATVIGTCIENLAKFGRVVSEIWVPTDRQTNRQTDRHAYSRLILYPIYRHAAIFYSR